MDKTLVVPTSHGSTAGSTVLDHRVGMTSFLPFAFPSPDELRALAARIDGFARAAGTAGHLLAGRIAALGWEGVAARAFRAQAAIAISGLRAGEDALRSAALALRRHADRVESALDTLWGIVRGGLATASELARLPVHVLRGLASGSVDVLSVCSRGTSVVGGVVDAGLSLVGLG